MAELYPPDATLHARSGVADPEQEVYYPPIGESPYYTSFYKMLHRLLDVARRAGDLRVYKDGELTFGVRAGEFLDGPTLRSFAGATVQELADDATNFIYLTAEATLTVSQEGFPDPADTPHHALAVVVTAGGGYSHDDITDCRGRSYLKLAGAMTAAQAGELVGGAATALHTHDLAGALAAGREAVAIDVEGQWVIFVQPTGATTRLAKVTAVLGQSAYAVVEQVPTAEGGYQDRSGAAPVTACNLAEIGLGSGTAVETGTLVLLAAAVGEGTPTVTRYVFDHPVYAKYLD